MANKQDKISLSSNEIIKNDYLVTAVKIMRIFDITRGTFDKWKKTKGFQRRCMFQSASYGSHRRS